MMSLKLLLYALERASLEYADTGNIYARERALQLIDELRDGLTNVEELLLLIEQPSQKIAVAQEA